jgi:hypothetical protein
MKEEDKQWIKIVGVFTISGLAASVVIYLLSRALLGPDRGNEYTFVGWMVIAPAFLRAAFTQGISLGRRESQQK